jgi:seryl-tRNA synthetase
MNVSEFNAMKGKLTTIISAANKDRSDIEAKSDNINFRINGLRSGTILTDKYGNKLTKEARIAEVTALQEDLNALDGQRKKIDEEIKTYEAKLKEMPVPKGGSKEEASTTSKEVKEDTVSKPSQQDINLAVQAINQRPEALEQIKANWSKLHPDAKFEDYIKLNPNKASTKK